MLKLVAKSEASKLGGIATTYRASMQAPFGTCPTTCPLLPLIALPQATQDIDPDYLSAVMTAVPRRGVAFTFTHFPLSAVRALLPAHPQDPQTTVLNLSCDTPGQALDAMAAGFPAVYAAPVPSPNSTEKQWPTRINGIRFVACPADPKKGITCAQCGGGSPLCARRNRDYIIVFPAHGAVKARVGTGTGGCYGTSGPTGLQWKRTAKQTPDDQPDSATLLHWVKTLPPGTILRHHIVGDLGHE